MKVICFATLVSAHFCSTPRDGMFPSKHLTRFVLSIFLLSLATVGAQECSDDTLKRCQKNVQEGLSSESKDGDDQCRYIRENFDCLLWQISTCLDKTDQVDNGDYLLRSWRYLSTFCESQGSWYTKQCFQRDDIRRCEGLLPARGFSNDDSSCRGFASFRDCVMPIVQTKCSASEQRLLGTYLMVKGQNRAWNCPRTSSYSNPASAPLAADTRYNSLSDSSWNNCDEESLRVDLQECRTHFNDEERIARRHNDSDMRHHKTCCALVKYEECVKKTVQGRCGNRRRYEERSLVTDMKQRYSDYYCNDHTMNECSSAVINKFSLLCAIITLSLTLISSTMKL
ncbi:hypothetical protein X975_19386, partial [Stegodyphus mimosarum]